MRKLITSTFGFSLVFLIYIWFWLSRHAWTSTYKGKELSGCNTATEKIVPPCSNCFLQESSKKKFQNSVSLNSKTISGKHCLRFSKLYGIMPNHTKYLTIGIPSVNRKKGKYLRNTLKSLVKNLDDDERQNVTIIVLIADSDDQLRSKRARETWLQFQSEINSGLILIIQTVKEFYPNIEITRRTFNDSLERIQWRSKQVTDFAFLFSCSQDVGDYFLILEDDIETSPHYVTAIRHFILAKNDQDWVSLTFSGFFIIGRLLKNSALKRLSDFLNMFYMEKPVDLLILQFFDLLVQNKYIVTRRIPGLFQHTGLFSSLEGKVQKAKDRSFSSEVDLANPAADIVTTLGVYKKHFPEFCYISSKKFFWGSAPKVNDTFDIILHRPIRLKKLSIISGNSMHKNDYIRYAQLKLSRAFQQMVTNSKANCTDFETIALFKGGVVDLTFNNSTSKHLMVQCIRIEFIKKQSNWILIKEIIVRGENN